MRKEKEKRIIVLLGVLFLVYPMLVDLLKEISGNSFNGLSTIGAFGSQQGYTIVNFVVMYLIGAY